MPREDLPATSNIPQGQFAVMDTVKMNIENPEKLLTPSGSCARQDYKTDISVTPTICNPSAPSNSQSSACSFPKRPPAIVFIFNGWWYMELACIFLSYAFFALYYWCLTQIDGKADGKPAIFSSIPIFINNASVLSMISVVLKLLMFVPVSSAMGQLSWYRHWDTASKPVADLHTFYAASRGPSGSVKLLCSRYIFNSFHTTLGAVVTIAALYLGPSMQNAVTESFPAGDALPPLRAPIDGENATMPFLDRYDHRPPIEVSIVDEKNITTDPQLEISLYYAWLYNMNPQKTTAPVVSLSGNCSEAICEWQNYTTLVAKSQCQSVPATLSSNGFGYSHKANINSSSVDAGGSNNASTVPALLKFQTSPTIPENSSFTAFFPDAAVVIVHLAAIADLGFRGVVATECVLYWQVHHIPKVQLWDMDTFSPSADKWNSTSYNTTLSGQSALGNEFVFVAPCNTDRGADSCEYKVDRDAARELQRPLQEFFPGYVLRDSPNDSRLKAVGKAMDIFARSWIDSASVDLRKSLTMTLDDYMSNIADAVTGYITSTSPQASIGQTVPFFSYLIRWHYMIYSGVMLVLSTYLLLYAMWKTRRMPVWKTSLLPFLYHGFQNPAYEEGYDLSHVAWMQEESKNRIVALRDEQDGQGLKLREVKRHVPI